jgi:hypothetical protein
MFCEEMRDSHEAYARVAVNLSFEKHDELVVELTVDGPRPTSQRHATEGKFSFDLVIEFVKNDMNHDHVGIQAIDSRRMDEIGANSAEALVPPSLPLVGKEPPKVFEQVRSGNIGDFVPKDGIR